MGANREPGDCWLFMAGIDRSTDCLSGGFLFYAPVALYISLQSWLICNPIHFICFGDRGYGRNNGNDPFHKGGACQPGEEFENRIVGRLHFYLS
jgi:hypothetical protein